METILIIVGGICIIVGFIGSFLPVIPGTPVTYCGLLVLQIATQPFTIKFLIIWLLIIGAIQILDNVIPAYGTKKFGGSPYGVWGSIIGMLVGLLFLPVGIVVGPLAGAFLGELIGGQSSDQALRSAAGSFLGLLVNILLKVIASGMMAYYFFMHI